MQDEIEDEDFDLAAVLAQYEQEAMEAQVATVSKALGLGAGDDDWEEITLG